MKTLMKTLILTVLSCLMLSAAPAFAWGRWTPSRPYPPAPLRDALPRPSMTPGALNPAVTPATLDQTVCIPGYSKGIRPPERYTEALKRRQLRAYGYADQKIWHYEEDHLVPLSIGGSPTSPRNLWPEPHDVQGGWGSYAKDRLEYFMWRAVCDGRIPLRTAQGIFMHDWIAGYQRYLGPHPDDAPRRGEWR